MSSTLKVVRGNGKTKNYLEVCGVEYQAIGSNIEIEVSVNGGDSITHDFYTDSILLYPGDVGYLVNSYGTTVDLIRVKQS